MSTIFQVSDRAYCMNAGSSSLLVGQLYCVTETCLSRSSEQTLRLVGQPDHWYNACRFARVKDPAARRWPTSK
jgi:hypothetical protein